MRTAVVLLFVVLIAAVAIASPAKNAGSTCARVCPQSYEPICGKAKSGTKERLLTFGNSCVLTNYNCEHPNDQFEKKANGECGDKVSVRLQ